MERGFKTWAEKEALYARIRCGLPPHAPLSARVLAGKIQVPIIEPAEIPGIPVDIVNKLMDKFAANWSAVTVVIEETFLIIHNTAHLPERQESNLMHELAHLLCRHKPARIEPPGVLPWASRSYDEEQEKEAEWLGACLQIPRDALVPLLKRRFDDAMLAAHFGASEEMVRFRRNITGADLQIRRQKTFYSTTTRRNRNL